MKKKLLALVLASSMLIGGSMTVFAEDASITDMAGAGTGTEVTGSSTTKLPVIKVTVPTEADIVINPFKMAYKADGAQESDPANTDQIIAATQQIVNESDVAIAVNVAGLCATPTDDVTVATASVAKATTKSVFLYLEVAEEGKLSDKGYTKAANQIAIPLKDTSEKPKVKPASKDAVVVLAAGDTAATKADFTIGGDVVANPTVTNEDKTVSAAPWVSTDGVSIEFKFTFTPQIVTGA